MFGLRRIIQLRPRPALSNFRPPAYTRRSYYIQPEPTRPVAASWAARLWFRRDGTPRSKLRGLVFTTILSAFLYATWSTLLVVEALDYEHYLLSTLVYIQRVDYDYTTVPIDEFPSALAYFADLCGYFALGESNVTPVMLAAFFADVQRLADGEEGLREKIHAILREAAGAVHDVLAQSKGTDAVETAVAAINTLDAAMVLLIALSEEAGGDGTETLIRLKRLRDQVNGKGEKGYEVLG
ncbi:hypothetical protein MKEN_00608900 [Mycena kentingensis (nom. inval.)]|nr:hypothetical protein MKEN_00608900 [Mycena kentingensis (nom. inval.)]